jgi:DNA-binding response OmpR family regulator
VGFRVPFCTCDFRNFHVLCVGFFVATPELPTPMALVRTPPPTRMPAEPDSAAGSPPGRVLVVDDLEANLDIFTRLLAHDGHVVDHASSGEEALQLIQLQAPDVVLLDVLMPGLDGFATCRELKSNPLTRLIPVVLITGLDDSTSRIQGIEAGADDFLTKPCDPFELRGRVRALLRIKRFTDELDSAESVIVSPGTAR